MRQSPISVSLPGCGCHPHQREPPQVQMRRARKAKARLDEGEGAGSSLGYAWHPVEGRRGGLLSWMLNNRLLRPLAPESWNVG
jgi:hypothetical protein